MAFVICVSCHHYAEIKPLRKGVTFKCSSCGARAYRAVRQVKAHMLNGGQMPADVARVLTHAALVSIANHRGYSPKWATAKYRAIYGEWPPRFAPEAQNPSGELLWWIRQGNRKYAAMMRERETAKTPEEPSSLMTAEDLAADWR